MMKEDFSSEKKIILFGLGKGEFGIYLGWEKVGEASINIYYRPSGIINALLGRIKVVESVPMMAKRGPYFPPGKDYGVIVLLMGAYGESWLANKVKLDFGSDIHKLQEEIEVLKLELRQKQSRIEELSGGINKEYGRLKSILKLKPKGEEEPKRHYPPLMSNEED